MKTKLRGFFGIERNGQPTPFGGCDEPYVVEFADDGIFFRHLNGARKPDKSQDAEIVFSGYINDGAWLKFERGNPFPISTDVRYEVQQQTKRSWKKFSTETSIETARACLRVQNRRRSKNWRIVRVTREVLP